MYLIITQVVSSSIQQIPEGDQMVRGDLDWLLEYCPLERSCKVNTETEVNVPEQSHLRTVWSGCRCSGKSLTCHLGKGLRWGKVSPGKKLCSYVNC